VPEAPHPAVRKVLLIGPLPEPITGHSLACQVLLEGLAADHRVEVVNLSKDSFQEGVSSLKRVGEVGRVLLSVWRKSRGQDAIYLTISESLAGNLKDLCIYAICAPRLSRLFLHLHGGSIKRLLWDRYPVLFGINRRWIRKMAGVIVSGRSHLKIFDEFVFPGRIHVVPNFAQDFLFRDEDEIRRKFSHVNPLRVLFISNFIPKKGFNELADAYDGLSSAARQAVCIDFAGRFESASDARRFQTRLADRPHLRYLGAVDDATKRDLFGKAHVFCLPTMFLEGQPISILEAYASGCVVATTALGGIPDIFTPGVNGFALEPGSAVSITRLLECLVAAPERLLEIALANHWLAERRYRTGTYCAALKAILDGQASGPGLAKEA